MCSVGQGSREKPENCTTLTSFSEAEKDATCGNAGLSGRRFSLVRTKRGGEAAGRGGRGDSAGLGAVA